MFTKNGPKKIGLAKKVHVKNSKSLKTSKNNI